jgi:hypothetical protein
LRSWVGRPERADLAQLISISDTDKVARLRLLRALRDLSVTPEQGLPSRFDREFQDVNGFGEGDRIELVGESEKGWGPKKGERGWLESIDSMDDIVLWDDHGIEAGGFVHTGRILIRRVGNRNEPDPSKRREHDPFGDT